MRNSAGIGFSASLSFYAAHPLSRKPNVTQIACVNSPSSKWSNVVYQINNNNPGQFSSQVCSFKMKIINYISQCII